MSADVRLAAPAAVGWAAAALLVGAPHVAPTAATGALVLAAIALVAGRWRAVALSCVVVALFAAAVAIHNPVRSPEVLLRAADSSEPITLRAVVDGTVSGAAPAHVDATIALVDAVDVRVPAVLFGDIPRVPIGTVVEVTGRIELTEPGDRAVALVFAVDPRSTLADGAGPTRGIRVVDTPAGALSVTAALRDGFRQAALSTSGLGGALLPGLAIGDTSAVPARLDSDLRDSALTHLTAVSGANCGIVVGLVMLLGGALGVRLGARVIAALVVLGGFVLLVTPEPSVQRASVMAAIALVALARGRPARGVPVLGLAVIVLLAIDPWLSRDYGFVLSAVATAALLLLAGPLADRLERWMPRWLAIVIAVPLSAQLACQPVLVLLDPSIAAHGVLANVLAAPAAPVATIVGMLACVTLPIAPWLGTLLCHVAWLPSSWIAAVAGVVADLPFARLPWLPGTAGSVVLATATGILLVAVLGVGAPRRWAVGLCAVLVTAYVAIALGMGLGRSLSMPRDWQFAACDVGQGDAMLVRSGDAVALVDTGDDERALESCLDALGIDRIDLLVLTHFDRDHVGAVEAVEGRVDVVVVGPVVEAADERLVAGLVAGGAAVHEVAAGDAGRLGDLEWRVLWPVVDTHLEGNDASVVLAFRPAPECAGGCATGVFLGDLGEAAQRALVARSPLSAVDVVKVSHHGSADQYAGLYESTSARAALIGVGADNGYGHPRREVLSLLEGLGAEVLRTDVHGLVLIGPGEAGELEVWTER